MNTYIAIDLKSFYASVECVERGLDPLTAQLVVADPTRTEKTICLAVSPALKEKGVPGRPRLFEVYRHARDFIIAPPQMRKYMEVSTKIFGIYAEYVALPDIHVYSVDEAFLDVTHYLKNYKMTARELAQKIIEDVLKRTGITATAGIGTNLYLAKVAMDIKAKHIPADKNGVRIAELDEKKYREELWAHEPITDFWRVGKGYAKKLYELGIYTMGDLAKYSLSGAEKLYNVFGKNAELLIDHAWGHEPTTMADIKNYKTENHSLSTGQVLAEPYDYEKARLIVWEMADALSLDLVTKNLVTDQIVLTAFYENGERLHGSINLKSFTNSGKEIAEKTLELFDVKVDKKLELRRFFVVANHARLETDVGKTMKQLDLFTDYEKLKEDAEKEKRLMQAEIAIKNRFGNNAILKLKNFEEGGTTIKRNEQVGGHRA